MYVCDMALSGCQPASQMMANVLRVRVSICVWSDADFRQPSGRQMTGAGKQTAPTHTHRKTCRPTESARERIYINLYVFMYLFSTLFRRAIWRRRSPTVNTSTESRLCAIVEPSDWIGLGQAKSTDCANKHKHTHTLRAFLRKVFCVAEGSSVVSYVRLSALRAPSSGLCRARFPAAVGWCRVVGLPDWTMPFSWSTAAVLRMLAVEAVAATALSPSAVAEVAEPTWLCDGFRMNYCALWFV